MQNKRAKQIAQCVKTHYKLDVDSLKRVFKGFGTRNWLLHTREGQFFVKEYNRKLDLEEERDALRLSEYAYEHGIPTPRIIRTVSQESMCVDGGLAFTLFEYISGATFHVLSFNQMAEAGKVLGDIHRHFKSVKTERPPTTLSWMRFDKVEKAQEIDQYLNIIEHKKTDDFDKVTYKLLLRRKKELKEVPKILKRIPDLTTQVIHNDYSVPNLLFRGFRLKAVVDFRPPNPFLISYEIGRIALNPENLGRSNWMQKAVILIEEYCKANNVDLKDVLFAPSIWLVQLIKSTYGVKQHYTDQRELQSEFDNFWLHRAHAATLILENLKDLENSFEDAWMRTR